MTNKTYVKSDGTGAVVMVPQMINGSSVYPPVPSGMVEVPVEPTGANVIWDFAKKQFVERTIAREELGALTARQFKLGLVRNSISLDKVVAQISAITDDLKKQEAQIEWETASSFERLHPLVVSISSALGLTDEQVDAMWVAASKY